MPMRSKRKGIGKKKVSNKRIVVDPPGPASPKVRYTGESYNPFLKIEIERGTLGKHGYAIVDGNGKLVPQEARAAALEKAIKAYGVDEVYKKLNYLKVVWKNEPRLLKPVIEDMAFIRVNHPKAFTKPIEESDIWDDIKRFKINIAQLKMVKK